MLLPSYREKMNVLLVIDGILFGGGDRVFLQLAEGLRQRGHQVSFACVADGELAPLLEKANIPVLPVDFKSRNSVQAVWQLYSHIRAHSFDIVNSQGGRADFYTRIAGRMAQNKGIISTVAMLVEAYDVIFPKRVIYSALDRFSERFADHFVVVSERLQSVLHETHHIPKDKITKIYNGIELSEYCPNGVEPAAGLIRKEFDIEDGSPLLVSVGRLVWQKGFEYFLRSAPLIFNAQPQARILIVGEGLLRDELAKQAKELGIDGQIIFTGFRKDVKTLLAAADLFVAPSLLEGFPMVTLEAMAMAKPIVATNIDGISEQIEDGKEGILVPPRDPTALAEAILSLMQDKTRAAKLGAAARQRTEKCFSVESIVTQTEQVYLSLLAPPDDK